MASPGLRLRARPAQNEAAATLIEHLRRAGPQLLTVEVTIKANPQKACPVFRLIGQKRHGTLPAL